VQLDKSGHGQPEEVKFYVGGKLARAQRDTNRDGKPDQWEITTTGACSAWRRPRFRWPRRSLGPRRDRASRIEAKEKEDEKKAQEAEDAKKKQDEADGQAGPRTCLAEESLTWKVLLAVVD